MRKATWSIADAKSRLSEVLNRAELLVIGKYYPYREIMNNEALGNVVAGMKSVVDPDRLMNPGALGL